MSLGLLGKKVGMTRVFDKEAGIMIPVTVVDVAGNEFVQKKTTETDGYSAVQVAYGDQKEFRLNEPTKGHLKKNGASPKKLIQEFRFDSDADLPNTEEAHPGASLFEEGQTVDVIGTTKGKGFQGVVKRYNFAGQFGKTRKCQVATVHTSAQCRTLRSFKFVQKTELFLSQVLFQDTRELT